MANVQKHSVAVRRMRHYIRAVGTWWRGGPVPARRWQIYFYYHTALAVFLGVFAVLGSRHYYPEDVTAQLSVGPRLAAECLLFVVFLQAALLPVVAPLINLRLLWLARRGGPSFMALALCDAAATFLQHLALLVAC